jgi:trigger factor
MTESSLDIKKENEQASEITITVTLSPEDENPFLDRSYKRLVGRLKVPGFRPGKAPKSIVESMVGRIGLVNEAIDFMVPESLDQALKENEISAFAEPHIELIAMEPTQYKATIPLEPTIKLGSASNINIEKEIPSISAEQVEEVLERVRNEQANWEPVTRSVIYGDMLNINVQGVIDGETVIDDKEIDFIPQETSVLPFPGFSPNLIDQSENAELTFDITIPEDYPRTEFANKLCSFQVTILSVKEKILPEIDDEFAKGVGEGFDDLAAFKANIEEQLNTEAEAQATAKLQEDCLNALVEITDIEASALLYERELDSLRREREQALSNQQVDIETYLTYIGKSPEEFTEELTEAANDRLNKYLVLKQFSTAESIEVNDSDVEAEIETMLKSYGESTETIERMRTFLNTENTRDSIKSSLFNRKVLERLVELATGSSQLTNDKESE